MAQKATPENSSQGIDIEQLMAAPFIAAATANSEMARKQTQFLMESCFDHSDDDDDEDGVYRPKMIVMTITKSNLLPSKKKGDTPKLTQNSTKFQIPLLTLIPFNSLCVTDVSVKFDLEIVSQTSGSVSSDKNSKGSKESKLKGMVSYDASEKKNDQYQRRNTSKLSVEMNAGSIPLPLGFTSLLELYTNNLNPTAFEKE